MVTSLLRMLTQSTALVSKVPLPLRYALMVSLGRPVCTKWKTECGRNIPKATRCESFIFGGHPWSIGYINLLQNGDILEGDLASPCDASFNQHPVDVH